MMSRRTSRQSQGSPTRRKGHIVIAVIVVVSLFAAWTMLARSPTRGPALKQKGQEGGAVSVQSLTSPSKEYIYAGGRLLATEEPTNSSSPGLDTIGVYNPATGSFFLRTRTHRVTRICHSPLVLADLGGSR